MNSLRRRKIHTTIACSLTLGIPVVVVASNIAGFQGVLPDIDPYTEPALVKSYAIVGDGTQLLGSHIYQMSVGYGNVADEATSSMMIGSYLLNDRPNGGGNQNSLTVGQYNEFVPNAAFVVGTGQRVGSTTTRENGLVVKKDGTVEVGALVADSLEVGGQYVHTLPAPPSTNGSLSLSATSSATGSYSFAVGRNTEAAGSYSSSFGENTMATGRHSAAFGRGAKATGSSSFAVGLNTEATSSGSFAAGGNTDATGIYSSAFGYYSRATGSRSFAAGDRANAAGRMAAAFGSYVDANGNYSTGFGYRTKSQASNSFSIGYYNDFLREDGSNPSATSKSELDPILSVGVGTHSNRENALTVYRNGNAKVQGDLTVKGAIIVEPQGDISMGIFGE